MEKNNQTDGKNYKIIYEGTDTRPACNQITHLLRSLFWQPNHQKHWAKEKKKNEKNRSGVNHHRNP